jgi:hypothetical protein
LSWGPILRGNQVGAEQRKPYLRKRRRKGLFRHTSVAVVFQWRASGCSDLPLAQHTSDVRGDSYGRPHWRHPSTINRLPTAHHLVSSQRPGFECGLWHMIGSRRLIPAAHKVLQPPRAPLLILLPNEPKKGGLRDSSAELYKRKRSLSGRYSFKVTMQPSFDTLTS